jgi:hypothetical protein
MRSVRGSGLMRGMGLTGRPKPFKSMAVKLSMTAAKTPLLKLRKPGARGGMRIPRLGRR